MKRRKIEYMNRGVHVVFDGCTKTVPFRLLGAAKRINFVCDAKHKRLSAKERFLLEEFEFKNDLKYSNQGAYRLIKNKSAKAAIIEKVRGVSVDRKVLVYNRESLRIIVPARLFSLWYREYSSKKSLI